MERSPPDARHERSRRRLGSFVVSLLLLAACSPEREQKNMTSGDGANGVEAGPYGPQPVALSSETRAEFRQAYGRVLWSMIYVRWCDERWGRPSETAQAEERLAALAARARLRGLQPEIEQAERDLSARLPLIRLDSSCRDGFDVNFQRHDRNVVQAESLISGASTK